MEAIPLKKHERPSRQKIVDKCRAFKMPVGFGIDRKTSYIRSKINMLKEHIRADKMMRDASKTFIAMWIAKDKKEIEKLEKYIDYLMSPPRKGQITDEDIDIARQVPIESLLPYEVKRNRTRCFNHEDKTPSAGIKNNKVHCFVCNETWSVIDVVMQLDELNFIEAVRKLNAL